MALQQKSRSLMNLSRATGFATSPRHARNKKLFRRKNGSTASLMSIYDDDIADSLSLTDESSVSSVTSTILEQNEDEEEVHDNLTRFPWFVGKLSRTVAESYLQNAKSGTYLVRESEGQRDYKHAIAVKWKNQPSHIRIYRRKGTYSVCTYHLDYFNSIEELVAFYQEHTLGDNFPHVNTILRFPYKSAFSGADGKEANEYSEDLPGSPELGAPDLPPRTPSMNIVNPDKPLQDQPWYHGKISRIQAEFLLNSKQQFSFLLRDSESETNGFSLSIRESTSGYVHLRISREEEGYVLGKFSKLFNTVPECILYYCHHKLNVKGASHGCLRYPVYR